MSNMTKERMGEIALALWMAKWTKEGGIKVGPEWRRARGQLSKDTGIPAEDLDGFTKEILVSMLMKTYDVKHVSLTMNNERPSK